jgi:formylglycine-generating enzyme required for sulfatase activity
MSLAIPAAAQDELAVFTPAGTEHQMILIPAGPFLMGSDALEGDGRDQPLHTVFLDAYHIDKYEVTVGRYRACVESGACNQPLAEGEGFFWGREGFDDYPVNGPSWSDADAYCGWAGLRLPTEAEWEKAARGTDGRAYPWGAEFDATRVRLGGSHPQAAGTHPTGVSPYGVHDMAGSVWEFVADWYIEDAYYRNSLFNPIWPYESPNRIVRGGSGHSGPPVVRTTTRWPALVAGSTAWAGFRCARDTEGVSYPRFQSAALSAEAAVVNRPIAIEAEVVLDRSLEEGGLFRGMQLDLLPAGLDAAIPLEHLGAGKYRGRTTLSIAQSGHHPLPVTVEAPSGERHMVCRLFLDVLPDANMEILTDGLAESWTVSDFKVESMDLAQTQTVQAGEVACSFLVESSFSGWQVTLTAPGPINPHGYTLRFAFHPGDSATDERTRFGINFFPRGTLNLLQDGLVDTQRREWQIIEIPLADIEHTGTIQGMTLAGNFGGTWHLDDVRLVAPEPPPPTAVQEERQTGRPTTHDLSPNYPNPFNSGTVIRFALPVQTQAELALFNLAGQRVATLLSGLRQAGRYAVHWDGRDDDSRDLASGIYLYRLQTESWTQTRKLLLLR